MVRKAIKHLRNAVTLAPAMITAHINLARALSRYDFLK